MADLETEKSNSQPDLYLVDQNVWFLYCPACDGILEETHCQILVYNKEMNFLEDDTVVTKTFHVRCKKHG